MASLFFSYSHKDEDLRDQLEIHLAGLKRQGAIEAWHDRRITAGRDFGNAIDNNLNAADIVLLLVSPDFISSDYCYEREMARALERHQSGAARVIPVILRPCDWRSLPFGHLLATPKDAKPITTWPNLDEAFLDVVTAIRNALQELGVTSQPPQSRQVWERHSDVAEPVIRSSNLRVRKQFTDQDKDRFRHESFEFIARFFEASLQELAARNPGIGQSFRRIDANRFTVAAYQNGDKVCRGLASISDGAWGGESISYAMTDDPGTRGTNEAVFVKADDQALYFETMGMQTFGHRGEKLTPQGAAELFWDLFIRPLQAFDR